MDPNNGQDNSGQRSNDKRKSSAEKAEQIKRDYGRTKKAVNTAKTGAKVGRQVATQGTKVAVQASRTVAQLGVQAAQAATQAAIATAQATIAAIQAAALATEAAVSAIAAASPVIAIVGGVILLIMCVSSVFIFFFGGTPSTLAGEPIPPAPNVCVGLCKASCLDSESDLGVNTVSCTDPKATHCCLPAGVLPPLQFYCQYGAVNGSGTLASASWRSWNYGTCDIFTAGCTPTSTAMILSSFGDILTPTQVSQQSSSNSTGCFEGAGFADRSFIQGQGFTMTGPLNNGSSINLTTISNYLTHGYYILGQANVFVAHTNGLTSNYVAHAFVITGVDLATGAITISDPTACVGGFSNGTRTLTNVNALGGDVNGWLAAYAIKKP